MDGTEQAVYDLVVSWDYEDAKKLATETGVDFDKIVRQFKEDEKELADVQSDLRRAQGWPY